MAATATAILLLVGGNLVDDRRLHDAASRERSDVHFLFGQRNIFDVYLELARLEDDRGVLHLGDLYYNTPGYYNLHQDVPFYDSGSFARAVSETGTEKPEEFAYHLITDGEFPRLPGYLEVSTNGSPYHYGFIEGATEVRQWQQRSIMLVTNTSVDIARNRLGVEDAVKPPLFEFVD